MGFSRQEYWSGLSFPSLGDLPDPGIDPTSAALTGRFFTTELPGKLESKKVVVVIVQLLSSVSLWPHEQQHTKLPCPSLSPRVCSNFMFVESVMPSNHFTLCHPLFLLSCLSHQQGLFQWVGSSHQVAKVLELQLQHQSFQWIFRVDFL